MVNERKLVSWLNRVPVWMVCVALVGCSSAKYKERAEKEGYGLIEEKASQVRGMESDFTIDQESDISLDQYAEANQEIDFFGEQSDFEIGARILGLNDALDLAVRHNRRYQNEKEGVFLQALSLSLSRFRYTPIFNGSLDAQYRETKRTETINGIEQIETDQTVAVGGGAGFNWFLQTGGRLAGSFTTDFLRYLIGDRSLATSSSLAVNLAQPLMRGAGYRVAMENLTQAERNLLYSLRSFARFRKEFTVSIVSDYYGILQDRDRVRNAWQAYQNFQDTVKRENARFDVGFITKAGLAELQENELTNEQSWINSFRRYRESLDRFKIQLGIPVTSRIVLDDAELDRLQIDLTHRNITPDEAIAIALESRLDYQTAMDQVEDAQRRIKIAANGLLPDIDLILAAQVPGRQGATSPSLDFDRYSWNAGLDVELPFNRKAERNNYRASLISYERELRNFSNFTDDIRLQIQNGWRNLEQAERNYDISKIRLELSESRLLEQELLFEIGEGDTFDLVRAQQSLTNSQNELTSARITHTLARLGFWRDVGILFIRPDGQWESIQLTSTEGNENE